jgi:hypothetical protein
MHSIKRVMAKAIFLMSALMLFSCTQAPEEQDQVKENTKSSGAYWNAILELPEEQQAAFDALNILQTNTDQANRLYSTFANVAQACYPPDTSFTISCAQLKVALNKFVEKHCKKISLEKRQELASSAVLAQEKYEVLFCLSGFTNLNYENGIPSKGTWVLPNILGKRDVVMVW